MVIFVRITRVVFIVSLNLLHCSHHALLEWCIFYVNHSRCARPDGCECLVTSCSKYICQMELLVMYFLCVIGD